MIRSLFRASVLDRAFFRALGEQAGLVAIGDGRLASERRGVPALPVWRLMDEADSSSREDGE